MIKRLLLTIALTSVGVNAVASTNLLQAYEQALTSDPIYQQAISQQLSTKEGVPISLSNLLPAAAFQLVPAINKVFSSGDTVSPPHDTIKTYAATLTLS